MRRSLQGIAACVALAFALTGPAGARASAISGRDGSRTGDPVLVFAASSLTTVLDAMTPDLEHAAGAPVTISYASSAVLARQIEAGAPAHLFLSADEAWMNELATRGLVRSSDIVRIARNRLVLIAPASSSMAVSIGPGFALTRALGAGRLAVGDPASVPAGKYAKAALEALGVWQAVQDRLAPGENVRVALQFVARGECPLGIVYATDARAEPAVRVVAVFPDSVVTPPISYPAATITARPNASAQRVLAFLTSAHAKQALERFGFLVD